MSAEDEKRELEKCKHKNSDATGESCAEGCCLEYRCKDCGEKFMVELPD
jgi:hypothetical protein